MAKVYHAEQMKQWRETLEARRKELFGLRQRLNEAWLDNNEPNVELEEEAQQRKNQLGTETLDELEVGEIEQIDDAIRRMEAGSFGVCAECGSFISRKRLNAIPWTPLCNRCAHRREGDIKTPEEPSYHFHTADLPPDFSGMSDEEIVEAIWDSLVEDGRVELQELDVEAQDGVVRLSGFLPSEEKKVLLLEILEDNLGLPDVVEEIRVEPVLWEREDRTPRVEDETRSGEEELLEGEIEENEDNAYESMKTGTPLSPPDQLIPEEEK